MQELDTYVKLHRVPIGRKIRNRQFLRTSGSPLSILRHGAPYCPRLHAFWTLDESSVRFPHQVAQSKKMTHQ